MTARPIVSYDTPTPRCPDQPRCRWLCPGRYVRFQRWDKTLARIVTLYGLVDVHDGGVVTVRLYDGSSETVSCGAVTAP